MLRLSCSAAKGYSVRSKRKLCSSPWPPSPHLLNRLSRSVLFSGQDWCGRSRRSRSCCYNLQYTSALEILAEPSRQSWNNISPAILPSGHGSLRFSFISHISRFSTTALYINQDCDRQSMTAFDFDLEITNSRIYQRAVADDIRRASVGIIRAPIPDRFQIPEERDEDNPEPFPEQATVPRLYDKDVKRLRYPVMPQWPLRDKQPASTRNVSRPSGSIPPGPSDAGTVATSILLASPASNFDQQSGFVDLIVDKPLPCPPPHVITVTAAISQNVEFIGAHQVIAPSFMSLEM
jgi:hypothetical protein